MKAYLRTDKKPLKVNIVAKRFNAFYNQFYVEAKVIKATYGYKVGETLLEPEQAFYLRAAHLKEKYCYAGRPDLRGLGIGPNFTFSGEYEHGI